MFCDSPDVPDVTSSCGHPLSNKNPLVDPTTIEHFVSHTYDSTSVYLVVDVVVGCIDDDDERWYVRVVVMHLESLRFCVACTK